MPTEANSNPTANPAGDPAAPARDRRGTRLLFLIPPALACAVALAMVVSVGGYYYPDTTAYVEHTWFTRLQRDFNTRPPVFSHLLDVVMRLAPPERRMLVLVAIEQASCVAIVAMLSRLGTILGRPWAGFFSALLAVLSLPLWLYAQGAQSETLYVFLVILAIFLFLKGSASGRASSLLTNVFASGVASGLAFGCRTVGVALVASVLAAPWLARGEWKLRRTAGFVAGVAITIAALSFTNLRRFGTPSLVNGGGIHMFDRIALLERSLPDTTECRALQRLNAAKGKRPDTVFYRYAGWDLFFLLQRQGLTPTQADRLLSKVSVQALLSDPRRTLVLTIGSIRTSAAGEYSVLWSLCAGSVSRTEFETVRARSMHDWANGEYLDHYKMVEAMLPPYPPRLALGAWFDEFVQWWDGCRWLWRGDWTLCALVVVSILAVALRSAPTLLFSWVALAQIVVTAIGEEPTDRYWDTSIPMFHAALAFAASDLWTLARARIRRRRDASSGAAVAVAQ
jgi:hypothetical protein